MKFEETSEKNPHILEVLKKALPEKLSSSMEIEVRLGTIMDKSTQKRLAVRVLHPCIMERTDTLWFEATVSESDFHLLQGHFSKMFEESESKLIIDTLLHGMRRSETKEINGAPVHKESVIIKKKKMFSLDIFCPQSKYDLRIGLSEEIVQKDTIGMQVLGNVREKRRTTYTHPLFVVDVTEVKSRRESTDVKNSTPTFEIEIEANNKSYDRSTFIHIVNNSIDIIRQALVKKP
ncbi:polynucleotide 5'-triphosphatase [Nematocida ausubeli]|nr:polynucleotide 5'-triphosphatase [Nematocida ausubeli]